MTAEKFLADCREKWSDGDEWWAERILLELYDRAIEQRDALILLHEKDGGKVLRHCNAELDAVANGDADGR